MTRTAFSNDDLKQIEAMGATVAKIQTQLDFFAQGVGFMKLNRACVLGNGIVQLTTEEIASFVSVFEQAQQQSRCMKMVPASGAASRMFKFLFEAMAKLSEGEAVTDAAFQKFCDSLQKFAFYEELCHGLKGKGHDPETLIKENNYLPFLQELLGEDGMNYGGKPKGVLSFHRYGNQIRIAAEEHLAEAVATVADEKDMARIHFTVSPEHMDGFKTLLDKAQKKNDQIKFEITYSVQKSATDTIAANPDNTPFRDEAGRLFFRPGGHGALIENLNDLKGDIVFIKNIDNVVPDRLKDETISYKKAIGGYLLQVQQEVFAYLEKLAKSGLDEALKTELLKFSVEKLGIKPRGIAEMTLEEAHQQFVKILDRPIRVCGMVKNEGEPGGGPFWVDGEQGESLQIVESSQIDTKDPEQAAILAKASHFNPVDLVCGLKDRFGRNYDLKEYVDKNACFISEKSKDGKVLKALELPGLWNGAMAYWNTIFVEVPLITFNPVKTVNDLLRPEHL